MKEKYHFFQSLYIFLSQVFNVVFNIVNNIRNKFNWNKICFKDSLHLLSRYSNFLTQLLNDSKDFRKR